MGVHRKRTVWDGWDGWMDGFRRSGRQAGPSPKLLGNAATIDRDEERAREQRGKEKAMPAVERLGRASPPLSVWLRAAAPEEIKKCPGVVVVVLLDGDNICLGSEKKREKKYFEKTENSASERAMETKIKTSDFLFLSNIPHRRHRTRLGFRRQGETKSDKPTCDFNVSQIASSTFFFF